MTRRPRPAIAAAFGVAVLACATTSSHPPPIVPAPTAPSGEVDPAASFARAEALYHEGRLGEARALLGELAERRGLAQPERVHALVDRGVVEAEEGLLEAAERSLDEALAFATDVAARPWAAKARFYLGELARARFDLVELDPATTEVSELGRQLETKASLLLTAQDLYLTAIAAGDTEWGVAAGSRIGELYEDLRRELVEAPLPPGLEGESAEAYRTEVRQRVRVLVAKAIDAYEETLRVARERRVASAFVPRMEEGLRRMRRVLDETPP